MEIPFRQDDASRKVVGSKPCAGKGYFSNEISVKVPLYDVSVSRTIVFVAGFRRKKEKFYVLFF